MLQNSAYPQSRCLLILGDAQTLADEVSRFFDAGVDMNRKLGLE